MSSLRIRTPHLFAFSLLAFMILLSSCTQKLSDLKFDDQAAATLENRVPASSTLDYSSQVTFGGRAYVESVLAQVFEVASGTAAATTLKTAIYDQYVFGGGCDLYGVSELPGASTPSQEFPRLACSSSIRENLVSQSNPMRFANTAKACESMIGNSVLFASAMKKVIPGFTPGSQANTFTPDRIKIAYGLFFQSEEPSSEVMTELLDLGSSASTPDTGWKYILISICISPEWQAL